VFYMIGPETCQLHCTYLFLFWREVLWGHHVFRMEMILVDRCRHWCALRCDNVATDCDNGSDHYQSFSPRLLQLTLCRVLLPVAG